MSANVRTDNYKTLILLLGVAAILPLFEPAMIAGLALSLMVAGWLVVARSRPANYMVLWLLAGVVILENLFFTIAFLS